MLLVYRKIMQKVQVNKVGLVFGSFMGIFHLVWSLMVATGMAQICLDFIFKVHMINPVYEVSPFSISMALTLIIITTIIGYIGGALAGWLWNKFVAD
ncbi:MAG: hypothetical protein WA051_01830 [Minisyncoccia bacterium]